MSLAPVIAVIHVSAAAAWFGAMLYNTLILYPRAKRFFAAPREYEAFIVSLAHGCRRVVLSAFAVMAMSGAALTAMALTEPRPALWIAAIVLKSLLLAVTLGVFWHISWRLWPARLFAVERELPAFDARFRLFGGTMLILVAANIVLGVVARFIA